MCLQSLSSPSRNCLRKWKSAQVHLAGELRDPDHDFDSDENTLLWWISTTVSYTMVGSDSETICLRMIFITPDTKTVV